MCYFIENESYCRSAAIWLSVTSVFLSISEARYSSCSDVVMDIVNRRCVAVNTMPARSAMPARSYALFDDERTAGMYCRYFSSHTRRHRTDCRCYYH